MTLIKTSLLNAVASVIKLLTLLGINKILAMYVGPTGYAVLGQFQNAIQIIITFASGAISTGVIKYTAEYYDNEKQQQLVWQTAGTITLIGSLITGLLISVFNKSLSSWLLDDTAYSNIFIWLGVSVTLFTLNTLLLSILNGKKEIPLYITANIINSIFFLVLSTLLIAQFGLYGALLALATGQSFIFFITLFFCYRTSWFKLKLLFGQIDKQAAKNLAKYSAMALTSAVTVPVSHILIRNHLGETLGWAAAGYWEAMWRLSTAYLMLITTTLSIYYLPRLSELKNTREIKAEIIQGYKIILPITIVCSTVIYLLRDFIITLLFTKEFSPIRELFAWQMLGDTLKIGSWLLAYVMLGQALVKIFITTEIIFSAGFFILTYLLTPSFGIQAPVIAHALNYGIYWMVIGLWISTIYRKDNNLNT